MSHRQQWAEQRRETKNCFSHDIKQLDSNWKRCKITSWVKSAAAAWWELEDTKHLRDIQISGLAEKLKKKKMLSWNFAHFLWSTKNMKKKKEKKFKLIFFLLPACRYFQYLRHNVKEQFFCDQFYGTSAVFGRFSCVCACIFRDTNEHRKKII